MKGKVASYNLEMDHFLFHFAKVEERELVLDRPWMVAGQALTMEQ